MGGFSFHETKNIQCGEGGLLSKQIPQLKKELKLYGANQRSAFWRGEVDKYNWVDIGSSFLPLFNTSSFSICSVREKLKKSKVKENLFGKNIMKD